jgi:protein TonB
MGAALAVIALATAAPTAVRAQQQSTLPIYASTDLESPPKLASPAQAAKVIDDSFPYPLRQTGVGGMVQLQIVIDARGRVEEQSIEVVETPNPALAEAARRAAKRLAFKPGYYKGEPVRTRVVLPILYKTVR